MERSEPSIVQLNQVYSLLWIYVYSYHEAVWVKIMERKRNKWDYLTREFYWGLINSYNWRIFLSCIFLQNCFLRTDGQRERKNETISIVRVILYRDINFWDLYLWSVSHNGAHKSVKVDRSVLLDIKKGDWSEVFFDLRAVYPEMLLT